MRRLAGALLLFMGGLLLGWIAFNMFVEPLPETRGRPVLPGLLFSAGLIYLGLSWIRGRTAR